jgi:hypothetical protein
LPKIFAACAQRFANGAEISVSNTNTTTVRNAPRRASPVLKNAEKWQRNHRAGCARLSSP